MSACTKFGKISQGGEPDSSMYAGGYVGSYGGVYNGYSPPAGLPSPPMSVPSPHSQVHGGQVKKSAMMMDNRVPVMNNHPQNHNQSVSIHCSKRRRSTILPFPFDSALRVSHITWWCTRLIVFFFDLPFPRLSSIYILDLFCVVSHPPRLN